MSKQTCYFCGSEGEIEQHHILPQRFDGSDKETNIVELCHDCHWKLERLYNKEFWNAIGVDDPRATKESHVSCDIHGCMNPSAATVTTQGGSSAYRCKRHVEDPLNSREVPQTGYGADDDFDDDPEVLIQDYDFGETPFGLVRDLRFILKNYLNNEPVVVGDLSEIEQSGRIEEIEIREKSSGFVTEFVATTEKHLLSAVFDGSSWSVESTRKR